MAPNSKICGAAETVDRNEATCWCKRCGGFFISDEKMRAHVIEPYNLCGTYKAQKDAEAAEAADKVAAAAAKEEATRKASLKKSKKKKFASVVTKGKKA